MTTTTTTTTTTKKLCHVCARAYEPGEGDYGFCPAHAEMSDRGMLAMVGITNGTTNQQEIGVGEATRIGSMAWTTREFARMLFPGQPFPDSQKMVFVEASVIDKIEELEAHWVAERAKAEAESKPLEGEFLGKMDH